MTAAKLEKGYFCLNICEELQFANVNAEIIAFFYTKYLMPSQSEKHALFQSNVVQI